MVRKIRNVMDGGEVDLFILEMEVREMDRE